MRKNNVEMNDEMMEQVNGGNIFEDIASTASEICDCAKTLGSFVFGMVTDPKNEAEKFADSVIEYQKSMSTVQ